MTVALGKLYRERMGRCCLAWRVDQPERAERGDVERQRRRDHLARLHHPGGDGVRTPAEAVLDDTCGAAGLVGLLVLGQHRDEQGRRIGEPQTELLVVHYPQRVGRVGGVA